MNRDQLQAVYDEWHQGNETQATFFKRKQLNPNLFKDNYRLIRFKPAKRSQPQKDDAIQLLPVKCPEFSPRLASSSSDLSLNFQNGLCLQFALGTSVDYLSQLSRALQMSSSC